MRQYEEARDPLPPGHGERDHDEREPDEVCRCGHGIEQHWSEMTDEGIERPTCCDVPACLCVRYVEDVREPDGVRYLGAGRYGSVTR